MWSKCERIQILDKAQRSDSDQNGNTVTILKSYIEKDAEIDELKHDITLLQDKLNDVFMEMQKLKEDKEQQQQQQQLEPWYNNNNVKLLFDIYIEYHQARSILHLDCLTVDVQDPDSLSDMELNWLKVYD